MPARGLVTAHRRALLAGAAAAALAGCGDPAGPPTEPSPAAVAYLHAALDLMQQYSINRYEIDWATVRAEAEARAGAAQTPAETYPAIRGAIEALGDHHSHLLLPGNAPGTHDQPPSVTSLVSGRMLDERIAYVFVPGFGGPDPRGRADSTQAVIRALDGAGAVPPCGWVVDLRLNTGGNMYPMVAGLGPLLGDGVAGGLQGTRGGYIEWYYEGGVAGTIQGTTRHPVVTVTSAYRLRRASPPVAVLYGPRTASSGEATAISFRTLPNARSFGAPTRGLSTGNQVFHLADGATLVLTVAVMGDRTRTMYGGPLLPDEPVAGPEAPTPGEVDDVVRAAMAWLTAQPACAGTASP
ncbi:MAG TPA: S41 family peptidase [Gemmatimonadaceae bacterium]|nr:S41 family peptidase [Gemmatimonadaceae bacterium]